MTGPTFDVVVPSIGRPSLTVLLDALAAGSGGPLPETIFVVDDRRDAAGPLLATELPESLRDRVRVLASGGRGPAAARNAGWRASRQDWVVFLDDDVVPDLDWRSRVVQDLSGLPDDVAASQGRVRVPLPFDRRPTDWERNVYGLERARWATADMAYRRSVLERVGGFDERFRHAYREDADLALRVMRGGHSIVTGARRVCHPVRPADRWVSVRLQAGNADDALMRAIHGPHWRSQAGEGRGRKPQHVGTTAAGLIALGGAALGLRRLAAVALLGWLAGTGELAWRRIRPGPKTRPEVATMLLTSALVPPAATFHWLSGILRSRTIAPTRRAA
jgi:hypothetical protein